VKQEFSVPALMRRLNSEAAAYELLEELRWNGHPVCPHCNSIDRATYLNPANGVSRATRTGAASQRRVWKCRDCRRQFSVLTGTFFHGTKISIRSWVLVILEMCASKNGVSAREIERKYDLTAKTAWFMLHRIREGMKQDALATTLVGTIAADETYIGGSTRNKHGHSRTGGVPAWARKFDNKTIVFALVHRESGEVRSRVVPDVTSATLRKAIAEHVNMADSDLMTDEGRWYEQIGSEFRSHETVNHSAWEYGRGPVTTNHAEGFFSQLKRSLDGTHHHVSREHLPRYLAQFDFLRSTYKLDDSDRMRIVLARAAGRRLSYKPLVGMTG
jgi:transposase-like protein